MRLLCYEFSPADTSTENGEASKNTSVHLCAICENDDGLLVAEVSRVGREKRVEEEKSKCGKRRNELMS